MGSKIIDKEMNDLIYKLWNHLSNKRKKEFKWSLVFMTLNGFFEFISLGIIIPFLSLLMNPEKIINNKNILNICKKLKIQGVDELTLIVLGLLLIIVILGFSVKLAMLYMNNKFLFSASNDFSRESYKNVLHVKYESHLNRNSSEIVNTVTGKVNSVIYGAMQPIMNLLSSFVISVFLVIFLLIANFKITFSALFIFASFYFGIYYKAKKTLNKISEVIAGESTIAMKIVSESLGGFRDILLGNLSEIYVNLFDIADSRNKSAQKKNIIIGQVPKIIVDSFLLFSIILISFYLSKTKDGIISYIPIIGTFVLAAQRLLPSLNIMFNSISNVQSARQSIKDVLGLLEHQELENKMRVNFEKVDFKKRVLFEKVDYKYKSTNKLIIENMNLEIKKGAKIGIIGETGSGKSTILDIIMGLLNPTNGKIYIDDVELSKKNIRSWQDKIAHVPQNIFLGDQTILENIAFGVPYENIDVEKVEKVVKRVKLKEFIESLPLGLETMVGERGTRLSGGQRQRVAIARALYKDAELLILDEGTSALDSNTESHIVSSINSIGNDITMIFVAHRLSTLEVCDFIYRLRNSKLELVTKFKEGVLK